MRYSSTIETDVILSPCLMRSTCSIPDTTLPMNAPGMGTGGPGYTIKAEFNKRPFERGILGMARKNDPDSAGSQIYIMLGAAGHLNGQYTAFGRVVSGMDVVDKIKVGDRVKSLKVN